MRRVDLTRAACTDEQFIELFEQYGAAETARRLNVTVNNIYARRRNIETRLKRALRTPNVQAHWPQTEEHTHRIQLTVKTGIVLVASDAHYWPGPPSTAHRALVKFCKELEPVAIVMNGDVMDCATISRHPPIGWEKSPSVIQEIEVAQERLHEISMAIPRNCRKIWTLGNHDSRFSTRLAVVAPDYARVHGFRLKDHFVEWENSWSVFVNEKVVIKHRFKGGIGATRANTLNAGLTMVTGHLHRLQVTGLTDYNGRRWGVDSGCIADISHRAFVNYTEDGPLDWASGFAVLSFLDGALLPPELVHVWNDKSIIFRGKLIEI